MLYPSKQIRKEYGNISLLTAWKCWQVGFHRPMKIRSCNFHNAKRRDEEIAAWIELQNGEEARP